MANPDKNDATDRFWLKTPMENMTDRQWESLCDGCARCCLNKLEDWDTGDIAWTDVACALLDHGTCRCNDYDRRAELVPDCIQLTPDEVRSLTWLPPTCAYRLIADGRDLHWWHPLISGDPETVHLAGISVRGRVLSETDIPVERYEDRIVQWPAFDPQPGISVKGSS